jgi:hypothetical protein
MRSLQQPFVQPLQPELPWPAAIMTLLSGNAFQDQTEALRAALLEVAQKSTEVDADSSRFPDGWLFSHRCACFLYIVAHALRQMPGASAVDVQVGKQTLYASAPF